MIETANVQAMRAHYTRRLSRVVRGLYSLAGALTVIAWLASSRQPEASTAAVKLALPIVVVAFASFLTWLTAVRDLLPMLGRPAARFSSRQLVGAFFVPFVALVRPYRMVREIDEALDSRELPLPLGSAARARERGYRDAIFAQRSWQAPAKIRFWWGSWLLTIAIVVAPPVLAAMIAPLMRTSTNSCHRGATDPSVTRHLGQTISHAMNAAQVMALAAVAVTSFATLLLVGQMQARLMDRVARLRARNVEGP